MPRTDLPLRPRGLVLAAILALAPLADAAAQGIAGPYLAAEQAARRGDVDAAARNYARVIAREPDNAELVRRTMLHQVAAGEVPRAMSLARRLESLRPGSHVVRLMLAVDATRRGAHEEARAHFSEAEDGQTAFVGRLVEAWATFGAGDADAAAGLLSEIEEREIGGPAGGFIAAFHAGLIRAAAGDDTAAIEAFERAAGRPGSRDARLARARAGALARLGRIDEARDRLAERLSRTFANGALERLDRALAEGRRPEPTVTTAAEGMAEALYGVSRFLVGRNRLLGLAHARLAVHLRADLAEAHLLIGNELSRAGQPDLAIEAYAAVPSDTPEGLEARIGAAEAHEAAGRLEEAVATLEDSVAARPRSVEAHTALGDMLRRNERFEEAAVAYDAAISLIGEIEQRHWPLLYQRGICYERSDQWALAEADFRKALELEPDQPQVLNYLGYSWVEMRMNLEKAQRMIETAVEQRPDDGYIVDSLGWVHFRLGDFDEAVEHLERAVELRPVDPVINDHYGDALWMVGRHFEAEFQWRRALSFDPDPEDAERIRRKLEVGLDAVLAEEAEAGNPAIIGRSQDADAEANDGG